MDKVVTEKEQINMLRLIRSSRVGPASYRSLLQHYGSVENSLKQLPDVARQAGVADYSPCTMVRAEEEYRKGLSLGYKPLFIGTQGYPDLLEETPDAPPMLWCNGNLDLLTKPCISIIGAKKVSEHGLEMAYLFGKELGELGYTIVSGLSSGIETEAHKGSLETGTIAVMAGGVNHLYPKENRDLFDSIVEKGLVVSEKPVGMEPNARHFPQRNRIIAGLSVATVQVEAGDRSASGMTLIAANKVDRLTMAMPPKVDSPNHGGHSFALEKGALTIKTAQDIHNAIENAQK